jgi:hypothetical protein
MLPDYPRTKAKLWKAYMKVVKRSHQHHLGFLDRIEGSFMHEGEADQLVREDGSVSEITPKLVRSTGFIPADSPDIEKLDMNKIMKGLHEAGRGLAEAKAKMVFEAIEVATRNAGTQVGPNSDPAEQIFEMIEKRQFDFDKDERPILGQFVVGGKEAAERIQGTMARIDSTPVLRRRMDLLIEQKRREFLDQEATRKLVD